SSKSHPGPVVHISDNPMDEGKLIIGFESGIVVLWDLKSKKADYRYTYDEVGKSPCFIYSLSVLPLYFNLQ
ncbi:Syntaxin-binding protein 5, partial [Ataeniobius toweri]|nr:Syntaxin-binding protein 5 [Ataeniobius toweri]